MHFAFIFPLLLIVVALVSIGIIVLTFEYHARKNKGTYVGTYRTHDAAFTFRMGAGFPGDVSRTTYSNITEPCLVDLASPPTAFGQPVVIDPTTQGARPLVAGDTTVYGITVRPYPYQQSTGGMTSSFGGGVPNPAQPIDVLKSGYIIVQLNGTAASSKNAPVFVWTAASAGTHVQGGFEAAATAGSTIALNPVNCYFNGPADPNGVVELAYNL